MTYNSSESISFLFRVSPLRYASFGFALCISVVIATHGFAQGAIRSADEIDALAEQYVIDFSNMNRQRRDAGYACIARGEKWTLSRSDGKERLHDMVITRLVDKSKSIDHAVWAFSMDDYGTDRSRIWDQRFVLKDQKFRRIGDASRGDWLSHNVPSLQGFTENVKSDYPIFQPFLCLIANDGRVNSNNVTDDFIEIYFTNFIGGTTDNLNRVVGVWTYGDRPGAVAAITFDNEPPHLPVAFIQRMKNKSDDVVSIENRESFLVSQINQITWGKHATGVPVPARLVVGTYAPAQGFVLSEMELEYQWKLGDEVNVEVPTQEQLLNLARDKFDWRAPIVKLFNEDFYASYREWKERRDLPKAPK